MADGAHEGVGAERALQTILGGDPAPDETGEKTMTSEDMREHLSSATLADCSTYDGCARYCGKIVLDFLNARPEFTTVGAEGKYVERDEPPDEARGETGTQLSKDGTPGEGGKWWVKIGPDLYDLVKEASSDEDYEQCLSELTGFMWGWAVNAAKFALEAPPVPNPAIL